MAYQTILPYVGGKQKVVRQLSAFFPPVAEMGSPFIGGGSIEVFMQAQGVRVVAGDLCRELVVFWQMMTSRPVDVAEIFRSRLPIEYPLDRYREELRSGPDDLNMAALFYILIECGFSHILARDSGGAPRQTANLNRKAWRSRYARLSRFSAPNLSVYWYDCFEFLERFPDLFLYCDPPYPNGSQDLYGFSEDLHSGFDHERFRNEIEGRDCVISYGDCELVRDLYQGWIFDELSWYYGAHQGSSVGHELVIRPQGAPSLAQLEQIRRDRLVRSSSRVAQAVLLQLRLAFDEPVPHIHGGEILAGANGVRVGGGLEHVVEFADLLGQGIHLAGHGTH